MPECWHWELVNATERWDLRSVYLLALHCYSGRRVAGLALQEYVCALEALTQLVLSELLIADSRVCPTTSCVGQVVLRPSCDNSGVCGAVSKASSMRRPLADVLQAMETLRAQRRVVLQVQYPMLQVSRVRCQIC